MSNSPHGPDEPEHGDPDDPVHAGPADPVQADLAERLRRRRDDLADELERLIAPPEEGSTIGFGKRIGEGTTEAVERIGTTAVAMSVSGSIRDLDLALASIEAGTYGTCADCGTQIPLARLEARPTATRCVNCAA